jgi:hypothetical protein
MTESNQTREAVERARAYLAEVRARDLPDEPPIIRARVTGELLRHGEALLGIVDDIFLPIPEPLSEKARRAAELLAEVPESLRSAPEHRHHDSAWAVSTLISTLSADSAAEVARWLRAAGQEAQIDDDGTEPYCTDCGEWVAMFLGMEGWHHFHGDPSTGGEHRALYDAGHEAAIGWRRPPGLALSPAGAQVLRLALEDALAYRKFVLPADCAEHSSWTGQDLCDEGHAVDASRTEAFTSLARTLGIEVTS